MRAESEVLVAVGLVIGGVIIGIAIDGTYAKLIGEELLPTLRTVGAAFAGAWAAFALQNRRNANEALDRRVGAVNRAIFALHRKHTLLRNIYDQIVKPNRDHPAAFLQMPAAHHIEKDEIEIDYDSLHFILETPDRQIMDAFALACAVFRTSLDSINTRSQVLISEFQPIVEKAGIKPGHIYDEGEMKNLLGIRLFQTLQGLGDQLVVGTERAMELLESAHLSLTNDGRANLDTERIISIRNPDIEHDT